VGLQSHLCGTGTAEDPPASQRCRANPTDADCDAFAKDANAAHFAVNRDLLAPGYPRDTHTVADSVIY